MMDFFKKVSGHGSGSESDEIVNYDKLEEMINSVSLSKYKKLSTNSVSKYRRKSLNALPCENGNDEECSQSKHYYPQEESHKDLQKPNYKILEEMNFSHNILNHVEKLKSRLDKQMTLSDHDHADKFSSEVPDRDNYKLNSQIHKGEVKEEELKSILTSKCLSYEDTRKLGEYIFHHKVPLKVKLFICLRLESESSKNRDVVRKMFDKSMMIFLEGLLEKYCCTISVFGRKNVQIEDKVRPPKDLCLLNPLTKLFATVACNPHSRYINLHVTSLFINAVTFIASNIDNIQKRIIQASLGKTLICKSFKLNESASSKLVIKILGLSLDDWVFGAYEIILFGTFGKEPNKNINEEIIKIQPQMDCTKLESQKYDIDDDDDEDNDEDAKSVEKYVTVARTKIPKHVIMYTEKKWKDHLKIISGEIHNAIKKKAENYFRNGDVVGFYMEDVELEHMLLEPVELLRGLIVSQQKGNVMIWGMDVGIWVFARRDKLFSLLNSPLASLEPLISVASLKGPVCDLDEEFLGYALSILRHASLKNNDVAKKMFLSDAGENLLLLAEHHDSYIRHPILDILNVLTKSREGCLFLHDRKFDLFITGKLEFWVHVSKSGLRPVPRIKSEIATMVKILSGIISSLNISTWRGMFQAKRALKILQSTPQDQNNDLFEEMLHQLEDPEKYHERKEPEIVDYGREDHHKNQENWPSSPPRNNRVTSMDFENRFLSKGMTKVRESSALVFENVINVKNDETTHIMDGKNSSDIRPLEMAEVLCGLLNNNVHGCIYFGLSQESVVLGIRMSEKEKKILKKDVEIITTKFVKPPLPDAGCDVEFITVLESISGRLQPKPETYVIKIRLNPHKRVVYSLHDGTRYYTRKGTNTIEHNTEKKEKKISNGNDDVCDTVKKSTNESLSTQEDSTGDKISEKEDQKEENFSLNGSQERLSSVDVNDPDTSLSFSENTPSAII